MGQTEFDWLKIGSNGGPFVCTLMNLRFP